MELRIEVEIDSEEVVIEQKGGYTFHKQTAYLYGFDRAGVKLKHPQPCKLTLRDNQPPFKKGMYVLSPSSIYINRWNEISLFPILQPVAPVAAVKSAASA